MRPSTAAYALYDSSLAPLAFILLGIVALATLAAALLHGPALAALGQVGAFVSPLLVASDLPNYWRSTSTLPSSPLPRTSSPARACGAGSSSRRSRSHAVDVPRHRGHACRLS